MQVKKLNKDAKLPKKEHTGDLGYDIFANEDKKISIEDSELVDTGVAIKLPEGWGCFVKDRSSYASKFNVETAAGTIDAGYRGEVKILVRNHGEGPFQIRKGDKIAQLVPIPVTNFNIQEVEGFSETDRGSDGFGSTGND